jgi:ligand-binding sensor domain-containing protein
VSSLTRGLVVADPARSGAPATRAVSSRGGAPPSGLGAPIDATSVLGLKDEDGAVWAMADPGLFVAADPQGAARFERFGLPQPPSGLTAGHVSALALDAGGRLWVGLFDGGIDVLDTKTGRRLERVDDADLHEVNALLADTRRDRLWVASSKGLAVFDGGRRTRTLVGRDGLVGENVAAIAVSDDGSVELAAATNAGASLFGGPVARSLTAFHGLPNNHTYAVALLGDKTFVGTLGGLAEIQGLRVGRVFTASDSRLPHNWVSALAVADGKLFVGTYGGGVATLYPSGELVPAAATKGLNVNPGAMAVVDRRLCVGTLGAGAYLLDLDSGRWTRISAGLSSSSVTAVAADDTYVYFGTEHGITRVERAAIS